MQAIFMTVLGTLVSIGRDLLVGPFFEWFLFWGLEQAAKSSRTKLDDELLAKIKEARAASKAAETK